MRRVFQGHLTNRRGFDDLIETGTLTSNTANIDIQFRDASYDSYEIRLNKVVPNQDDVIFQIRTSVSAGFGFATDANYYYNFFNTATGGAGSLTATAASFILGSRSSAGLDIGNASGEHADYVFYVSSPAVATEHTFIRFEGAYSQSNGNTDAIVAGAGRYLATQAVTAIRFFLNSGNFQRGTYEVIGHRNAV